MSEHTAADLLAMADAVLAAVPAGEAEVTLVDVDRALTRYASNAIHQNVAEQGLTLRLRLQHEGRTGVAEVRGGGAGAVERVVRAAEGARRLAPVDPDLAPLPVPDGGPDSPCSFSETTAAATPERRAEGVATICRAAEAAAMQAYGAFSTVTQRTALVSTAGVRRHAATTVAAFSAVVRGADGAGYADRNAVDVDAIDAETLGAEVVDTAQRNQGALGVEPGPYRVVLSPYAVAEMVEFMSWMGFGALALHENRSFMRLGEKLMSDAVTIRDDAADPDGLQHPFDWEGVSRRRVTLVDGGVCHAVVYDTPTARHDHVSSTGHALPMPNTFGPLATHLVMDPGDASRDELLERVGDGIYVTRFWYVREVHPLRAVITGMTREGTFRIEGGRLGAPVRDLRFTESIVDTLATVLGISGERTLQLSSEDDDALSMVVPWVALERFTFTS